MEQEIEIIILTKSSKNHGFCVAGIDRGTGNWIRLVSNNTETDHAISFENMEYEEGGLYCNVLDIVRVNIIRMNPSTYQPENVLINESVYWKKIGTATIEDVLQIHPLERHSLLLGNIYRYITSERIGSVGHSLILVKVDNLTITHPTQTKTKATFCYNKTTYEDISVTDPEFYGVEGGTIFDEAIIVMSLPGIPYQERRYYKFVAKIFTEI